jgi:hypothetical protein
MIGDKVLHAPCAFRLKRADIVAQRAKLAEHAAQKVRVPVVPAGAK